MPIGATDTGMMQLRIQQKGFTIVELLIVIVVIAILAAITIVAYNGITNRARVSAVQTSVSQASRKVLTHAATNADNYPATLSETGINESNGTTYQYTSDNTVNPKKYCVTATNGTTSFYSSNTNQTLQPGICPGHNLVVWNKSVPASMPLSSIAEADTSTFKTATASMKVPPNSPNVPLVASPFSGNDGQTYTISLWLKSESNWNGTNANSKIRIGRTDGSILQSCTYDGVKVAWTQVICSFKLTAAVTSINIRVGNDATVGNIWIDDLVVSKSE